MDYSPTSLFDSYESDFQQLISGIKVKLEVEAGEQKGETYRERRAESGIPGQESLNFRPCRDFFMAHLSDPYPNTTQKRELMQKAKISAASLNQWLTNTRRRSKWMDIMKDHANGRKENMKVLVERCLADTPDDGPPIDPKAREAVLNMQAYVNKLATPGRVELELDEADRMMKLMEVEILAMPQSIKSEYQSKVSSAKAELAKWKKQVKELRQLASHAELSGPKSNPVASNDPYGGDIQSQRTPWLQDIQTWADQVALETEGVGTDISRTLTQEHGQIDNAVEPPHQTQQHQIPQPNTSSTLLPELSHLEAWPSREQFAQADAHTQQLLREAVKQRELERPAPTYDIPADEELLYDQNFEEICAISVDFIHSLASFYIFSPKEEDRLKVAINDLVGVMEQQRKSKAGQKVYLFTLRDLELILSSWKQLMNYNAHLLRAAEKLPGSPQSSQQQQPIPPPATMPIFPTQPQPPLGVPPVSPHPKHGVKQPAPVSLLQPLVQDNTQLAPVAQHSRPLADSFPSTEQPQLLPSGNSVASSQSSALEASPSPNAGSIPIPTSAADSPKIPNSPVLASEFPKGEPGNVPHLLLLPPNTHISFAKLHRASMADEGYALNDDPQMETNVDPLVQSDGIEEALTKPECTDCQCYRERLLQKEIQIRALSDLLSQKPRKGARLLPRLFSSRTKMHSTAFVGSEICESRPEYRGNTVYPSSEDFNTGSRRCCVIQ